MAEEGEDIVETLRERGLTCSRLKSLEKREREDAKIFRSVGFGNIGDINEQVANKIKSLRNRVCKLR